ncbi:hypothetical protein AB4Y45_35755 [Paraburkholderia sp. EG287A]|uniref:hypothetical protein n=1 Tax=Paraburkholderia sp. EG287A TaxID=3237012 RepID=UPI0034D2AABB
MTMKMVATAAVVLAHGAPVSEYENCAYVATKLYEYDVKLLQLAHDEVASGADHGSEIDSIVDEAGKLAAGLQHADAALYYNDELPRHPLNGSILGGRLRIELNGSPWDLDNPIYFALPEEALGSNAPR